MPLKRPVMTAIKVHAIASGAVAVSRRVAAAVAGNAMEKVVARTANDRKGAVNAAPTASVPIGRVANAVRMAAQKIVAVEDVLVPVLKAEKNAGLMASAQIASRTAAVLTIAAASGVLMVRGPMPSALTVKNRSAEVIASHTANGPKAGATNDAPTGSVRIIAPAGNASLMDSARIVAVPNAAPTVSGQIIAPAENASPMDSARIVVAPNAAPTVSGPIAAEESADRTDNGRTTVAVPSEANLATVKAKVAIAPAGPGRTSHVLRVLGTNARAEVLANRRAHGNAEVASAAKNPRSRPRWRRAC